MHATIMVTNGGPHPADYWARTTADHIFEVAQDVRQKADNGDAYSVGIMDVRNRLETILEGLHSAVQGNERANLDHDGDGRLGSPLDPAEFLDDGVAGILGVFKGTSWEKHFAEREGYLRDLLAKHFKQVMDIERSWFADRNQDESASAAAYKEARMVHGPMNAPEAFSAAMAAVSKKQTPKGKRTGA